VKLHYLAHQSASPLSLRCHLSVAPHQRAAQPPTPITIIVRASSYTAAKTPWWSCCPQCCRRHWYRYCRRQGGVLIATVFAAVYHAEVVADRTGEPFGTIILAVAVTKSAKPPLDC
jgi:hypothetical protein